MTAASKLEIRSCQQQLRDMTAVADGKYCHACQRTLVDLRSKSNDEIVALLHKKGEICGVIASDQVPVSEKPATPPKPHSRWRTNMLAMYSTLGLAIIWPQLAKAQTPTVQTEVKNQPEDPLLFDTTIDPLKNKAITIHGQVLEASEAMEPLPFVNIYLADEQVGTTSDFDGNFTLTLPNVQPGDTVMLTVAYIGFQTKHINLTVEKANPPLLVKLEFDSCVMGAIVIVESKSKRFFRRTWWRMRHPFR